MEDLEARMEKLREEMRVIYPLLEEAKSEYDRLAEIHCKLANEFSRLDQKLFMKTKGIRRLPSKGDKQASLKKKASEFDFDSLPPEAAKRILAILAG